MDPSLAPDFVPPSQRPRRRLTQSNHSIPNLSPVQSYVWEDFNSSYTDSFIDPPPLNTPPIRPDYNNTNPSNSNNLDIPSSIPRPLSAMSNPNNSSPWLPPIERADGSIERNGNGNGNGNGLPPVVQSADLEEVPKGVVRQAREIKDYEFPIHRLSDVMLDESKSPLVLVACGSFSPITYLHLRMFEMAMDSIREHTRFEVIGGYYSPVSDNYNKPGLARAHHRVRMCELACERTSSWLMVDAWESLQPTYTRTALVLDHFNEEINVRRRGVATISGNRKGVKIMLLAGGDLIESMGEPNVWAEEDLHHILGRYGCLIVERTGSDVRSFLLSHDIMYEHRRNVLVIKQLIYNDISSTKVRLFIRRGMSVQYLLPNSVIRYIIENRLYVYDSEPVKQVLDDRD